MAIALLIVKEGDLMNNKNLDQDSLSDQSNLECLRLISDGSGVGYMNGIATLVPRVGSVDEEMSGMSTVMTHE